MIAVHSFITIGVEEQHVRFIRYKLIFEIRFNFLLQPCYMCSR
jgi:hypothetical protein